MEDWQEWQIRADRIAAELGQEVDVLERDFFADSETTNFRAFWPRHKDLKERVRVAPAIKLEDKLELERRLRNLGSRAHRAREAAFTRSGERKAGFLSRIEGVRAAAEGADNPRDLRTIRRDLDTVRKEFDADGELVPADRQSIWEAWRATNQEVWDRLTGMWSVNEQLLRDILSSARQNLERGNANAVRQDVRRFFESLRGHETKQEVVTTLKAEADALRHEAEEVEDRRTAARTPAITVPVGNPVSAWRDELERNRESLDRLMQEVSELEQQVEQSGSVLEQAMLRGSLVEKRSKATELERSNRQLEQRISQAEESPLIPTL